MNIRFPSRFTYKILSITNFQQKRVLTFKRKHSFEKPVFSSFRENFNDPFKTISHLNVPYAWHCFNSKWKTKWNGESKAKKKKIWIFFLRVNLFQRFIITTIIFRRINASNIHALFKLYFITVVAILLFCKHCMLRN